MNIKMIADSTCDLCPELLSRYNITLTPLYVIMDGKTYRDGVDIHPADIFRHVDNGGKLCSTSAVNVEDYRQCFAQYAGDYDAVIQVTIGSNSPPAIRMRPSPRPISPMCMWWTA